jgi:bifunctional UDP-N-acetylglucosamine pyrophosphorylase/glucosamine-1-phosphate N-acetyltransferase
MHEPMAVILAAGKGTRMKSDLPKVLSLALGRPLLDWVLDALDAAGVQRKVVVVGYREELVRDAVGGRPGVEFAVQSEQLGTGHAVRMAREAIGQQDGPVVVLAGDSPMIRPKSLKRLLDAYRDGRPGCLLGTLHKEDPTGLGRIVRDVEGAFTGIVEQKDATPAQQAITEVNMSTYVFDAAKLLSALDRLGNSNTQREYYLTDCPGILLADGERVEALPVLEDCESLSVNTPDELILVEAELERLAVR